MCCKLGSVEIFVSRRVLNVEWKSCCNYKMMVIEWKRTTNVDESLVNWACERPGGERCELTAETGWCAYWSERWVMVRRGRCWCGWWWWWSGVSSAGSGRSTLGVACQPLSHWLNLARTLCVQQTPVGRRNVRKF